jgi:predicted adenylyl cyclase CyaB
MPNIEAEVRILLKNRKAIEKKVLARGAKMIYFSRVKDYWFCPCAAKNHLAASLDKTGFALRIRETKDMYNGRQSASLDCKTLCDGKTHALCNEYELDLGKNVATARKLLESIGLKEFLLIDKERVIYKYGQYKLCFDKIKGLGNGLEIEKMTSREKVNNVHAELLKFAAELGIDKKEILEKSLTYLAMEKMTKF